jgi:hypothetical protein
MSNVSRDEMLALAERCEKATGADRDLDLRVKLAVLGRPFDEQEHIHTNWPPEATPAYTASLDAAMTLVPEGWRVTTENASFQKAAWLHPENGQNGGCICSSYDRAKTVALALCAAALRARATKESKDAAG